MNITSEELLKEARVLEPQLQQWRRTLHRHPEVGFDLPHTKELVKKALTEGWCHCAGRRQKARQDHPAACRYGRPAHPRGFG